MHDDGGRGPERLPVSVVMQRSMGRQGQWSFPKWEAVGVLAGEAVAAGTPRHQCVHQGEDGVEQIMWTGLVLGLHRDSAESYWYNLVGKTPSLFIGCRPGPDGDLAPFVVSANYDEAGAFMEADETVFSVPMPPEVYRRLEDYVVANYRPEPPRKRKRKSWTEEADSGTTPPPPHARP